MPIQEQPHNQEFRAPEERSEEKSVESLAEVLHLVNAQIDAIFAKANRLLQIKADAAKFAAQNMLLKVGLGVLGFVVLSGVTVLALFLFLLGLSYALSSVLGGRLWLSHMLTGIMVLAVLSLGAWLAARRLRFAQYKKTRAKYAS